MPTWEPFTGTTATEPPAEPEAWQSLRQYTLGRANANTAFTSSGDVSQSSPLSANSFPSLHIRIISICLLVKDVFLSNIHSDTWVTS